MNANTWLIDEVADHLISALGMTSGANFFVGEYPEPGIDGQTVQNALWLIEMPGPAPSAYLDTETHLFDLWVSSSDTESASILLMRAFNVIHRAANFPLANWYVYSSLVTTTIHDESRGQEGDKKLSLGFTVVCRNMNNLS